jgi:glycosyltransferase involved in cell wall biosynthesis
VAGAVAFVLKGYPRLSETFIAQEIHALERRGLDIRLISLRHPTEKARHPVHEEIKATVNYLPEYLYQEPLRVFRAWRAVRHRPGYREAKRAWLADLKRDVTPNRIRRFGQALVLAHELPADVDWLHAHFLHTPASVTRYAAKITGLPWTCSAHAIDIWTTPDWEKREKLGDCRWLVSCTAANVDHLKGLAPEPDKVSLAYHGLDLSRFTTANNGRSGRDGSSAADPVQLLSVGRAVNKKGYDILIDALASLPSALNWRLVHIGGGEGLKKLKGRARRAGIGDRIDWLGGQAQEEVIRRYRAADLFVLACRVSRNGDRDGLPNVLMEAQSQGLACLSTRLPSIAELIDDEATGVLVPPDDAAALSAALARLIADPNVRQRLGEAGLARIRERFSFQIGIDFLAGRFGLAA